MANQIKFNGTVFSVGDTVCVNQKIREGEKMRIQPFEGVVIYIKGRGENKKFNVRKIASGGIGVERIWPVDSPWIEKVEVKKKGQVRRAKLYYLRKRTGKKATRLKAKVEKNKNGKKEKKETADGEKTPRQSRRKNSPRGTKKK